MKRNERLIYVPLGGAGEIGMNMYLYGVGGGVDVVVDGRGP